MKHQKIVVVTLLVMFLVISCSTVETSPPVTPTSAGMSQTLAAMAVQQTLAALPTQPPPTQAPTLALPTLAPLPSATPLPTLTPPAPTFTWTPTLTASPVPTSTFTPSPTATVPSPTPNSPELTATLVSQIQTANILIYEDAASQGQLLGRIDEAIALLGINESRVVNTGEASGDFMYYFKSGVPWDLVIIAQEDRAPGSNIGLAGNMMEYMQVQKGALILEGWNFDTLAKGNVLYLLDECGVSVMHSWYRRNDYDPLDFFIQSKGFDEGNPILNTPNMIYFPLRPTFYWKTDVGDVLKLGPGSRAYLTSGLYSGDASMYGLQATCFDGRMVLQSFSSHDYRKADTIALYQNYIYNTLHAHFEALGK